MGALDLADVHLIGHDWGASIAVAAACRLGGRIRSLSLLAVPHPVPFAAALTADLRQLQRSWYMFFFQIPGLSEYVVRRDDFAFLEHLWRSWSPGFEPPEAVLAEMRRVFAEPGVVEASLGYYRAALGARGGAPDPYSPPVMAPTLGLCGAQDGCIGADIFLNCLPAERFPGGVRGECIAGAGHFLHLEAAEAVETRLRDHLARHR
ncbi:MAG: alpha/beta hydrolase [Alphaproteobacteria bacterium]|nr:alpha/beta hydrolase [Alphaproteobacteria bacterium]